VTRQRLYNIITALLFVYLAYVTIARLAGDRQVLGRTPVVTKVVPVGHQEPLQRVQTAYVFWATWCGPCRVELSRLSDAIQQGDLPSNAVAAISIDDTFQEVETFLKESPLPMPVFWDNGSHAFRSLSLAVTPTTILLGTKGEAVHASSGLSLAPATRIKDHIEAQLTNTKE